MAALEDVYCTLVMTPDYLPGAAVLAHSLRESGTSRKLACLITQDSLPATTVQELQSLYNYVIPVERLGTPFPANLYLMNRPDLLYTLSKINLWRLAQFRKVVYLDADVVALRAPDELFDTHDAFAASPDIGWPDIFNTGVMVLAPSDGEYHALRTMALAGDSFDGADQGLLNQYFEHRPWKRLSFTYNCTPNAGYQYEPAYRYFKSRISLVHFIGANKPWQRGKSAGLEVGGAYGELVGRWWAVWERNFGVAPDVYTATGRRYPTQRRHPPRDAGAPTYSSAGYPLASTGPAPPPEATSVSTETPMTEPLDPAEALTQGLIHPEPTSQQRKFSAPAMEWDATRAAPPSQSRPEAKDFPSTTYEFATDRDLFRPPAQYPAPPRDMWYEVPTAKPPMPAAIFPWEQRERPTPARIFAEDEPVLPPPPMSSSSDVADDDDFAGADELAVTAGGDDGGSAGRASGMVPDEPKTPTIRISSDDPWSGFSHVSRNAWDDVQGIEDYVRALTAASKRASAASKHARSPSSGGGTDVGGDHTSPTTTAAAAGGRGPGAAETETETGTETDPANLAHAVDQQRSRLKSQNQNQRRASLRLTDFPSADERPSLPVTPAPRRKGGSFWGREEERGGAGDEGQGDEGMVAAEGVPDQGDWVSVRG